MTEQERQQKIARALVKMSQLATSLAEIGSEFSRATVQLERLAAEFEQGRYLPETSSVEVAVRDGEDPATPPV